MNEPQLQVLKLIIATVLNIKTPKSLLIGIDGKDASGKTTFANNLASTLKEQTTREVIRISLDDFFQPRAVRSRQQDQARGCYEDTFDITGIIKYLLDPVKASGAYTTKIFDYKTDSAVEIIPKKLLIRRDLCYRWRVSATPRVPRVLGLHRATRCIRRNSNRTRRRPRHRTHW